MPARGSGAVATPSAPTVITRELLLERSQGEESEDATTRAQEEETVMANKETLRRLCDLLNEGAVTVANRSCIEDHAVALQAAQVKTTKPTTTFRGDLEFTPWML